MFLFFFFSTAEGGEFNHHPVRNAVLRVAKGSTRPAGPGRHLPWTAGWSQGRFKDNIILLDFVLSLAITFV